MKICRCRYKEEIVYGLHDDVNLLKIHRDLWLLLQGHGESVKEALTGFKRLPVFEKPPGRVFCVGKNYMDHVEEMKDHEKEFSTLPTKPIFFTKHATTLSTNGQGIFAHQALGDSLDYEVELVLLIGKEGLNLTKDQVKDHIAGYFVGNDVTMRVLQKERGQWVKGKSLDSHTALSDELKLLDGEKYPPAYEIKSYVNGELRQKSCTDQLIFSIDELLSDLSQGMTLLPGDLVFTGTPKGVGMGYKPPRFLKTGDRIKCIIDGVGHLENVVI